MNPLRTLLLLVTLLPALSVSAQVCKPTESAKDSMHEVNFQRTPLETVLDLYGEITGKAILLEPDVAAKEITFKSRQKLTANETLIAIETLLQLHGIGVHPYQEKFLIVQTLESLYRKKPFIYPTPR